MNLRKTSKTKFAWIEQLQTVTDCIADWSRSDSNRFDAVTSVATNLVKLALQFNSAAHDSLHRRSVASTRQKDKTCRDLVPLQCLDGQKDKTCRELVPLQCLDEHPEWRMRLTDQTAERIVPRLALIIRLVAAVDSGRRLLRWKESRQTTQAQLSNSRCRCCSWSVERSECPCDIGRVEVGHEGL